MSRLKVAIVAVMILIATTACNNEAQTLYHGGMHCELPSGGFGDAWASDLVHSHDTSGGGAPGATRTAHAEVSMSSYNLCKNPLYVEVCMTVFEHKPDGPDEDTLPDVTWSPGEICEGRSHYRSGQGSANPVVQAAVDRYVVSGRTLEVFESSVRIHDSVTQHEVAYCEMSDPDDSNGSECGPAHAQ